jgi:hypothetical protein
MVGNSYLQNLTLCEILRLNGNTYNSIDMRAILARPKNESNAEWTCLFLKPHDKYRSGGIKENTTC